MLGSVIVPIVEHLQRLTARRGEAVLRVEEQRIFHPGRLAEADRILQKIHEQGEASLTSGERKTLERYSRRMRQR